MSVKKPLVIEGSEVTQILSGDNLDPATLGTGTRDGTRFLRDDGTWQEVEGGAGGVSVIDSVTPYRVKAVISSLMCHLVVTLPALTINLSHALMDLMESAHELTWAEGDKVLLSFASAVGPDPGSATFGHTGIYVLGSLASPTAVPLTRDPDFLEWQEGAIIQAAHFLGQYRAQPLFTGMVLPDDDEICIADRLGNFQLDTFGHVVYLFPWYAFGGTGVLPGGLAANTRYSLNSEQFHTQFRSIRHRLTTDHADPFAGTPVNITSAGTGSDGGEGPVALFVFFGGGSSRSEGQVTYVRLHCYDPSLFQDAPNADWSEVRLQFGSTLDAYSNEVRTMYVDMGVYNGSGIYETGGFQIQVCETLPRGDGAYALAAVSPNSDYHPLTLGYDAVTTAPSATAVGNSALAAADHAVAIGTWAEARHQFSVVLGSGSDSSGLCSTNPTQLVTLGWNGADLDSFGRLQKTLVGVPYGTPDTDQELPYLYFQFSSLVFFKGRVVYTAGDDASYATGSGGAVFEIEGSATSGDGGSNVVNWRARKVAASSAYGGSARIRDITVAYESETARSYMVITVRTDDEPNTVLAWHAEVEFYEERNDAWTPKTMSQVQRVSAQPGPVVQASEALVAGQLVNLWNSGGARVRKADATAARAADGFVLDSVASGEQVTVYMTGENPFLSGLSVGRLYVGDAGAVTATVPTAGIAQEIGFALSATRACILRGTPIVL